MPQSAVAPRSKGPQRRLSTTAVRRAASKSWCAARADRPAYVVPWRWRWDAEQAHAPRKGVCQRSAPHTPHTVRAVRAVRTRRSAGRPGRAPACARPRRRRTGTFARETRRATVRADPATPARPHARTPNAAARVFVGCGPSCWASLSRYPAVRTDLVAHALHRVDVVHELGRGHAPQLLGRELHALVVQRRRALADHQVLHLRQAPLAQHAGRVGALVVQTRVAHTLNGPQQPLEFHLGRFGRRHDVALVVQLAVVERNQVCLPRARAQRCPSAGGVSDPY